ncbi:uncharacterized protein LOC128991870 [Macrosteles quadrilineatus]|uniref:uncharacterized protein LOC128991870 n=1 Tax=Macrosteles quadrilineatus TaxID=74068 RepID=UPI0023E19FB1|nr:uncharacterized protein LOC128991870 [Macrosteles quadrilineatus]
MGKEDKYITLSEIDHKLQFVSVIAVIEEIIPVIYRGKLIRIELCLSDQTVTQPGFNVKLKMEKETLSQFLNIAKTGYIIQLKDVKVTKNEGCVYGESKDEEEITLFDDSHQSHKWYPGEKSITVNDSAKKRFFDILKWKRTNFKQKTTEVEKSNTRRSGPVYDEKGQLPSKALEQAGNPATSRNKDTSISKGNKTSIDKISPQNRALRHSPTRKVEKGISNPKNEPMKLRESKSSTSSEDVTTSITTKLTKSRSYSNLNGLKNSEKIKKSLSLSKLNKSKNNEPMKLRESKSTTSSEDVATSTTTKLTRTRSNSNLNKLQNPKKLNKSLSLSKLDKSKHDKPSKFFSESKSPSSSKKEPVSRLTRALGILEDNVSSSESSGKEQSYNEKKQSKKEESVNSLSQKRSQVTQEDSFTNTPRKSTRDKKREDIDQNKASLSPRCVNEKSYTGETCNTTEEGKKKAGKRPISEEITTLKKRSQQNIVLDKSSSMETDNSPSSKSDYCSPKTASLNEKTQSVKRGEKRKYPENNEIEMTNLSRENINSTILATTKKIPNTGISPTARKIIALESEDVSDISQEQSPKSKPSLLRSRFLNSSDSTLSEGFSDTESRNSRGSLRLKNRECQKADVHTNSAPEKKIKLNSNIVPIENKASSPDLNLPKVNLHKASKEKKTDPKSKDLSKNKDTIVKYEGCTNKRNKSDLKTKLGSVDESSKKIKLTNDLEGTTSFGKNILTAECDVTVVTSNKVKRDSKSNEYVKSKNTRNAKNSWSNSNKQNNDGKFGIYESYLKQLTKQQDFRAIADISDISLCELEEADVPNKIDLECKIVSEFVLVEEGIQVVRVQDGTVCKCGSLRIPQGQSWDSVTREILDCPVVVEKSPYIDIIIFNYFRLDIPLKVGQFFRINNVMGLNFKLKNDPRIGKRPLELFFCVEGQHANVKRLSKQHVKELMQSIADSEESLSSATIEKITTDESPLTNSSEVQQKNSPKIDEESNLQSNKKSPLPVIKESNPPNKKSPLKIKPAFEESKTEPKNLTLREPGTIADFKIASPTRNSPAEININKATPPKNSGTEQDKTNESEINRVNINTLSSIDETMIGETPPLLREIKEIMAEESALGIPFTETEDVHLKNSGSEVTFTQFCEGAKLKSDNFRTSTQTTEIMSPPKTRKAVDSVENHPARDKVVVSEDSSKMEPLVYSPSSSSVSSAVGSSPEKGKPTQEAIDSKLTPSVQKENGVKTSDEPICLNIEDSSGDSSVKILSSNNSIGIDLDGDKNASQQKSIEKTTAVNSSKPPGIEESSKDVQGNESLSQKVEDNVEEVVGVADDITNERIEVISDTSSIASLLDACNDATIKSNEKNNNIASLNDETTFFSSKQFIETIGAKYYHQSPYEASRFTEEDFNQIYNDETRSRQQLSYAIDRNVPLVSYNTLTNHILRLNRLNVTVIFTKISPSISDSWKDNCFKARCPTCDKLYDVYNAANGRNTDDASFSSAIVVGSHVVCPDSQCCNASLESPEFHFSVEMRLLDNTPLTALLAGETAEKVFGCSAQNAVKHESCLNKVEETLEIISRRISDKRPTKIVVTRKFICDPKSGPLFIMNVQI